MDWPPSCKGSVATATQSRSPRLRRGAVRLRPWNGDLSLLRVTHHDPDLSRPEVQPEQRCCVQRSAPNSCLSRSESRQLTTARRPLKSPAPAGLLWLICLQDLAVLPSNVQTKLRRLGTHPRQSQHQSAPHQLPPASTPPVAAPDHRTKALLNQRLIRLIDASKRLSRTTEIGMVLLHQFSMRLLDLSEARVGLQAQHP